MNPTTSLAQPTTARYAPRPAVAPQPAWSFPTPEVFALSNGIEVRAFHMPGKGLVHSTLLMPASAYDDPAGLEGLAALSLQTLTEGCGDLDAVEFAAAADALGAQIAAGADKRGAGFSVSATVGRFMAALELGLQALSSPRLADEDLNRAVAHTLEELAIDEANPTSLAWRALDRAFYPTGTRTAIPTSGTRETVSQITPDDVRTFVRGQLGAQGAVLLIAGDLAAFDLPSDLEAVLGSWTGAEREGRGEVDLVPTGPAFVFVDDPDAVQSEIMLAWPTVNHDSEWWAGVQVVSHALGGGVMNSRLHHRLRAEKGYTYGVGTHISSTATTSRLMVTTAVETGVTALALADIFDVLMTLKSEGLQDAEHARVVSEICASAPLDVQGPQALLAMASDDLWTKRSPGARDAYLRDVAATTPESAMTAFMTGVDHDRPVLVIVGDAGRVLADVTEVGSRVGLPSPVLTTD